MKTTIYALVDPRDLVTVRYIGQTSAPAKRLDSHCSERAHSAKARWIQALKAEGLEPVLRVLAVVEAAHACLVERQMIEKYAGHNLLNSGGVPTSRKAYEYYRGYLFRPPSQAQTRHSVSRVTKTVPLRPPSEKVSQDVTDETVMKLIEFGMFNA